MTNRENESKTRTASIHLFDWIEQYKKIQESKGIRGLRQTNFMAAHLEAYGGRKIRLNKIDKQFCVGFIEYLKNHISTLTHKHLSMTSIRIYCNRFNAVLNLAVKEEKLDENPFTKVSMGDMVKGHAKLREYLTIKEVKMLVATPCRDDAVKSAFLFSCCCGLRISDVTALTWGNLMIDGENSRAEIIVKKTQQPLYLPLSMEALKWLPERGNAGDFDKVFGLKSYVRTTQILREWAREAGIKKNVTFHTSRHTFATTLLTLGTDLYTTSKLLGHNNVNTTQIYAKIVNKKKIDAVNLFNDVF